MAVCFICQGKHDGPCPRLAKLPAARKIPPVAAPTVTAVPKALPPVTPTLRAVTGAEACPFCHGTGRKLHATPAAKQRAYRERKKNGPPA